MNCTFFRSWNEKPLILTAWGEKIPQFPPAPADSVSSSGGLAQGHTRRLPKPPSGDSIWALCSVSFKDIAFPVLLWQRFKKLLFIPQDISMILISNYFFPRKEISSTDSSELKIFSFNCMFWMKSHFLLEFLLEFRRSHKVSSAVWIFRVETQTGHLCICG